MLGNRKQIWKCFITTTTSQCLEMNSFEDKVHLLHLYYFGLLWYATIIVKDFWLSFCYKGKAETLLSRGEMLCSLYSILHEGLKTRLTMCTWCMSKLARGCSRWHLIQDTPHYFSFWITSFMLPLGSRHNNVLMTNAHLSKVCPFKASSMLVKRIPTSVSL